LKQEPIASVPFCTETPFRAGIRFQFGSSAPYYRKEDYRREHMPPSTHNRAAELHNLAAHAHAAAATAHGKGDHLTAHELSQQAREHSMNAHKLSEELASKSATIGKP
jgi:hypothetical protein